METACLASCVIIHLIQPYTAEVPVLFKYALLKLDLLVLLATDAVYFHTA